ncbi:MAG: hypothetical protein ABII68_10920 [Pseudomonadota bacterium]
MREPCRCKSGDRKRRDPPAAVTGQPNPGSIPTSQAGVNTMLFSGRHTVIFPRAGVNGSPGFHPSGSCNTGLRQG